MICNQTLSMYMEWIQTHTIFKRKKRTISQAHFKYSRRIEWENKQNEKSLWTIDYRSCTYLYTISVYCMRYFDASATHCQSLARCQSSMLIAGEVRFASSSDCLLSSSNLLHSSRSSSTRSNFSKQFRHILSFSSNYSKNNEFRYTNFNFFLFFSCVWVFPNPCREGFSV